MHKFIVRPIFYLLLGLGFCNTLPISANRVIAQENSRPNGIFDERKNSFAFVNATVYQHGEGYLENITLLISDGVIVQLGRNVSVPDGYTPVDLSGKTLYPGFIDSYSDYGLPAVKRPPRTGAAENLPPSNKAFNVNDAIRSHYRASDDFTPDADDAESLRKMGFTSVATFLADGIARGTSVLVNLGSESANEEIVLPNAAAHYSLKRGSSSQYLPRSIMGTMALLRQTNLDAQWFENYQEINNHRPFADQSLDAWIQNRSLPQIMEVDHWQQALVMDRIGDEFNVQYILQTNGDSYKRIDLISATQATLIVPVDFPAPPQVDDIVNTGSVSLQEMKHWELAPYNLARLAAAEIPFAITSRGAEKNFLKNLRIAVKNGLSPARAISALTEIPAQMLGVEDRLGSVVVGFQANFIITNGPLFDDDTLLLESWIQGNRWIMNQDHADKVGSYDLFVGGSTFEFSVTVRNGNPEARISLAEDETTDARVSFSDDLISISFSPDSSSGLIRLNGWVSGDSWVGQGENPDGSAVSWSMNRRADNEQADNQRESSEGGSTADEEVAPQPGEVIYPFVAFGRQTLPVPENVLIQNATVWTNEDEGVLVTDVLVEDGKIKAIGNNLDASNAVVVNGRGKHLTPGIIDEHSHIALFNINEVATNSGMVRMRDVVNAEHIGIYRDLAGGVTAAQLLHGSANPIGGQSAFIKLRWGKTAEDLLVAGADPFIKFALGENVKRSSRPDSIRYPKTRMGVEQVYVDAFTQAREYEQELLAYDALSRARKRRTVQPRRDLVDETMLEILNKERFVTSHSYVQSEINMLINVAESFNFNINTFTHILEGYKVADKMAAHGAGGSTFADWWGYKWEVRYAIPYNAPLMHMAGVVTAINSDDAEMSRRLNQEAAKSVKYGGMSEIEAFKQVTLNPVKLLHVDNRMGSIKVGKDADLVLWSDHPLSIYAVAEKTWVDGTLYYDIQQDLQARKNIKEERARLITAINRSNQAKNTRDKSTDNDDERVQGSQGGH